MADKLVISKNEIQEKQFTQEEIEQRELDNLKQIEQDKIDSLKPSSNEIKKAERQVNLIADLTELGVI